MTLETLFAGSRLYTRYERVTRAPSIALPSLHKSFEKGCQAKSDFFFAPVLRYLVRTELDECRARHRALPVGRGVTLFGECLGIFDLDEHVAAPTRTICSVVLDTLLDAAKVVRANRACA